ncbi:MAG: prefoldin subunit alpha [Candidatus Thermoplasmatota archaeon]|nr:prefoldin subunit alpha [Candidatus Thermoplasmatota archaeon]
MTPEQEMPSEQQVRESYMMLESAKAQLEGLAKQQELIQLAVEEHVRARETIKEIAKGTNGDEVLVPLGADSYIHANISDNKDAIVGVGSGVSIRRSPEEAEKILDTKIDDLSRAFKSITDKAAQTETMIQELSEKVQAQYDLLQSGGKA